MSGLSVASSGSRHRWPGYIAIAKFGRLLSLSASSTGLYSDAEILLVCTTRNPPRKTVSRLRFRDFLIEFRGYGQENSSRGRRRSLPFDRAPERPTSHFS